MPTDLPWELAELQRYADGLRNILAEAQLQAPRRAVGADRAGAVKAVLDQAGLPRSFVVAQDWAGKIAPGVFGAAVLEAFQSAAAQRLAEWTRTLDELGLREDIERLRRDARHPSRAPAPAASPPAVPVPRQPRPLGELAEEMMRAFDSVPEPKAPTVHFGSSATGKLTLTLSEAGLLSCDADSGWVGAQNAAGLMNALKRALSDARRKHARTPEIPGYRGELDGVLAEVFAVLSDRGAEP